MRALRRAPPGARSAPAVWPCGSPGPLSSAWLTPGPPALFPCPPPPDVLPTPAGSRRRMSSGCGRNTVAWWRGCERPVRPGRPTPTSPTPCFPTRCSRVSRGSLVPPAPCPAARPAPAVADAVLPQRPYPAPSARPSTSWASCGGCWSTSSGGCGCSTWCRRARLPSSAAWRSECASSASPSGVAPHSRGGGSGPHGGVGQTLGPP